MIFDEALRDSMRRHARESWISFCVIKHLDPKSYRSSLTTCRWRRGLSGSVVAMQDGKITESTIFSNLCVRPEFADGQSMSSSRA